MDFIINFFQQLSSLGPTVLMPLILTLLGMLFGVSFGKSLKAGITVGVGFLGLQLVIGSLMGADLSTAVTNMVTRFGLELSVIDVGWPSASAIAMGSLVGVIIIPLGLLVNIIMLFTKTTQTIDVDIWNYWHFAFTGSLVYILTDNITVGIVAAIINEVIVLVMADWTAKDVEEALGMPGVSIPHGFSLAFVPIAWVVNKIIDLIPGVRDIDINFDSLKEKFGVFGDPVLLGSLIGLVIGLLAGYGILPTENTPGALSIAVAMGAAMVLIPKMAALLMEGLLPISDAASKFIKEKYSGSGKIYIGLDSAIGTGNTTTLTLALLLVPFTLLLALIVPGNRVMPLVDLAVIPFMLVLVTPVVHNNGFRGFIVGIVVIATGLLIATNLAPLVTMAAQNVDFNMGGAQQISCLCDGANPFTWLIVRIGNLINGWGILIPAACALAMALYNRRLIIKQDNEA